MLYILGWNSTNECMTSALVTNANVKANPNPNTNLNCYTSLNQKITLALTICRQRYHRRSNCCQSKCRITLLTYHMSKEITIGIFFSLSQVGFVYSLLSMLGSHDRDDMASTLLMMSRSADSCLAMRQSGKELSCTCRRLFYIVL